jgi:dephospho-CoA kinase
VTVVKQRDELVEIEWFRFTKLDGSTGVVNVVDVMSDPSFERAQLEPISEEEAELELARQRARSN